MHYTRSCKMQYTVAIKHSEHGIMYRSITLVAQITFRELHSFRETDYGLYMFMYCLYGTMCSSNTIKWIWNGVLI